MPRTVRGARRWGRDRGVSPGSQLALHTSVPPWQELASTGQALAKDWQGTAAHTLRVRETQAGPELTVVVVRRGEQEEAQEPSRTRAWLGVRRAAPMAAGMWALSAGRGYIGHV